MSTIIERKYYFFLGRTEPRPPDWKDVPEWVKEFAQFVEETAYLQAESRVNGGAGLEHAPGAPRSPTP